MKLVLNGILLSKIDYSENSLILKFYTEEEGIQSFLFQGGKKKKGNSLFPLSITEISCYKRSDSSLSKISAVNNNVLGKTLYFDPIRSSVQFFIAEILNNCLKNEEADAALYTFLCNEIRFLERTEEFTNYPIYFLLELTKYLGSYPRKSALKATYFDIEEGEFTAQKPVGHKYINNSSISYLNKLVATEKNFILAQEIPKRERKEALNCLIKYYIFHQMGIKELKSLTVLESILYN